MSAHAVAGPPLQNTCTMSRRAPLASGSPGNWARRSLTRESALESAKILDFIRERNLVSNAIANGAVITGRGVDALGRYSWTLQIPLRVTYQSANERTTQELLAEVVVSRVPTWESPSAIGITRITMRTGR